MCFQTVLIPHLWKASNPNHHQILWYNEVFQEKLTVRQKNKNKQYYYNKNLHISLIITLMFHLFFCDVSDLWFNAKLQGVGEFRQHKGGAIRFLTNEEAADDRRMRLWLYALS